MAKRSVRQRLLDRVQRRLARRGSPRLEMALVVCATGAAGFWCSAVMHLAGVRTMALRYALAVVCAYVAFLLFVWIWLHFKRSSLDAVDIDPVDALDLASSLPADTRLSSAGDGDGDSALGDLAVNADEAVVVLVVVAALLASVAAAGYLVAIAPAFFAEVLLDGVLSYGLYRRLRGLDRRHWLNAALARTVVPFAIVAVFFALAGAVMQRYVPDGDSIGDVWNHFRDRE